MVVFRYEEEEFNKQILSPRPLTGLAKTSPRQDVASSNESSPRSPRARTAPPGYKTMPPLNKTKKVRRTAYGNKIDTVADLPVDKSSL